MGTTYEYNYEYEVADNNKNRSPVNDNTGHFPRQTQHGVAAAHTSRTNMMDSLAALQHDRIWHKLYDPLELDKTVHEAEIQRMARRQDRKVIKIEAAYGSDRQTFTVKRNYDLHVRDVQEDAGKAFKIPTDEIILYWKGRNICETPNELLETLGIENNHTMKVCRADDPVQRNRLMQQQQQYTSSNTNYTQQQQQQQQPYTYPQYQQVYSNYPTTNYDQQYSPRNSYYQQMPTSTISGPVAATYVINLQIGYGDRVEGLVIGRPHPITIFDLQMELQQRFSIPVLDQNVSYNGMPLMQFPPDSLLETIGIVNNSFISLWYKNVIHINQQQQQPPSNDYYSSTQSMSYPYYEVSRSPFSSDISQRRMDNSNSGSDTMQNGGNQEVLKLEIFHGSDRHVLILRSSNNIRIMNLMEELQRITTIPIQNQKLYYRGQELQLLKDRTLRDFGIENNAQVRLIGDPVKPKYDALITGNRPN